jgi:hypothetical protein
VLRRRHGRLDVVVVHQPVPVRGVHVESRRPRRPCRARTSCCVWVRWSGGAWLPIGFVSRGVSTRFEGWCVVVFNCWLPSCRTLERERESESLLAAAWRGVEEAHVFSGFRSAPAAAAASSSVCSPGVKTSHGGYFKKIL